MYDFLTHLHDILQDIISVVYLNLFCFTLSECQVKLSNLNRAKLQCDAFRSEKFENGQFS